jgi:AraC-like DNA-binding protein
MALMLDAENMVAPVDATLHYSRQVLSYLANHYTSGISMDDLLQEVGLTKSYICRLFKRHTGCTITEYVNRLRCYQATYLIENGHSVTEVAAAVGFNDYNYFSRVFKKVTGYRPSEDMRKIKEDVKYRPAQIVLSAAGE